MKVFIKQLAKQDVVLTEKQLEQFEKYFELLVEWNEKMNLTAITEREAVYFKHFYDSLTLSFDIDLNDKTLCDIGSGAGFPAIPLKIAFPTLEIHMVEPIGKRCRFLNHVIEQLELKKIYVHNDRAEQHVRQNREKYDICTARAVSRLNLLSELCVPLVKLGGKFVALKGKQALEEHKEAKIALKTLGCELANTVHISLPYDDADRYNLEYNKVKLTPVKYPRDYSQIKKKPL